MGVILWCECFFYINTIMKTELLNEILGIVSEVCEVEYESILSHCKKEEVLYARCIFVNKCKDYGIPNHVLAEFLNRHRGCVIDSYVQSYKYFHKQSYIFRLCDAKVSERVAAKFPV